MLRMKKAMVVPVKQCGNSIHVRIPPDVMELLNWNLNDMVNITLLNESVVLTKIKLPSVGSVGQKLIG